MANDKLQYSINNLENSNTQAATTARQTITLARELIDEHNYDTSSHADIRERLPLPATTTVPGVVLIDPSAEMSASEVYTVPNSKTVRNYIDEHLSSPIRYMGSIDLDDVIVDIETSEDYILPLSEVAVKKGYFYKFTDGELEYNGHTYRENDYIIADRNLKASDEKLASAFSWFNSQDEDVVKQDDYATQTEFGIVKLSHSELDSNKNIPIGVGSDNDCIYADYNWMEETLLGDENAVKEPTVTRTWQFFKNGDTTPLTTSDANFPKTANYSSNIPTSGDTITLEVGYKVDVTGSFKITSKDGHSTPEYVTCSRGPTTYNNIKLDTSIKLPDISVTGNISSGLPTGSTTSTVIGYKNMGGLIVESGRVKKNDKVVASTTSKYAYINFRTRVYYGILTDVSNITSDQIKGLAKIKYGQTWPTSTFESTNAKARTMTGLTTLGLSGGSSDLYYFVYAYPAAWKELSSFKNSGGIDMSKGFTRAPNVLVTNDAGLNIDYIVYYYTPNQLDNTTFIVS